jgi:uncharacterized cupin superfamily protein
MTEITETTSMHFTTSAHEGFHPSYLITEEDQRPSQTRPLFNIPNPAGNTTVGIWHAEPGTYHHPGGGHETFVVLEGEADFDLPTGTVRLVPGSVTHIPANTPTVMRVEKTLRKVAVVIHGAD